MLTCHHHPDSTVCSGCHCHLIFHVGPKGQVQHQYPRCRQPPGFPHVFVQPSCWPAVPSFGACAQCCQNVRASPLPGLPQLPPHITTFNYVLFPREEVQCFSRSCVVIYIHMWAKVLMNDTGGKRMLWEAMLTQRKDIQILWISTRSRLRQARGADGSGLPLGSVSQVIPGRGLPTPWFQPSDTDSGLLASRIVRTEMFVVFLKNNNHPR